MMRFDSGAYYRRALLGISCLTTLLAGPARMPAALAFVMPNSNRPAAVLPSHHHHHRPYSSTMTKIVLSASLSPAPDLPTTTANANSATNGAADDDDDADDYAEFLDMKDRRRALQKCSIFSSIGAMDLERMVQLMERIPVEQDAKVFVQGDSPDGLYMVASGTFDCYEESTGLVKATLGPSDVFGEVGLLYNEPRALSVKATCPDSSVWRLDREHFNQVVTGSTKQSAVEALEDLQVYEDFLDLRARQKALASCKIFQNLSHLDTIAVVERMTKVQVDADETVIVQGSSGDDCMYFVQDGAFECFRPDNGSVVKVCQTGSFFGELALFFSTPRRLSVKATVPSTVWQLSRDDFFAAIQESAIDEQALEVLRRDYENNQGSISLDELYQLLVVKSRPKKKPVSFHSTFSTIAAGVYMTALVPIVHPGLNEESGFPSIIRLLQNLSPTTSQQMQLGCWLFAVSAILGLFRFPPRTLPARKRMFEAAAATNVFLAVFGSCSLTGQPAGGDWQFDAFSTTGRIVLGLVGLFTFTTSFGLIDDAIAGDDQGRESISGADTRQAALAMYTVLYVLAILDFFLALPIYASADPASFNHNIRDFFHANGIDGMLQGITTTGAGNSAFGSLLATLQFEKKITPQMGSILAVLLIVLLNYDAGMILVQILLNPDAIAPELGNTLEYSLSTAYQTHYFEIIAACTVGVVLNALRKKKAAAGMENEP